MPPTYCLDSDRILYLRDGSSLSPLSEPARAGLPTDLNGDQHFFKTPFRSAVYAIGSTVAQELRAHPTSFYPGSPFDVFAAVRAYLSDGTWIVPRFYLYPTSRCNARCPICQFRHRRLAKSSLPFAVMKDVVDRFLGMAEGRVALSTIVSGDGEPTLHPDLPRILHYMAERGIRIFLTTNWLLPERRRREIIDSVASATHMVTVSIKGLDSKAYRRYQGLADSGGFERVLDNLAALLAALRERGRRRETLVGVATLILPENAGLYHRALRTFVDLGIDYVYLNPVEPSYGRWGITFDEDQRQATLQVLSELESYRGAGTLIRFPRDPFRALDARASVYYPASTRAHPDICGSALWNPLLLPALASARLVSCRNSALFDRPEFWFTSEYGEAPADLGIDRVMAAARTCDQCRLERQVRLFDGLIDAERRHGLRGRFLLEFAPEAFSRSGGALAFEDTM